MGVVGKVGSGKSSLLSAISAEMNKTHGEVILHRVARYLGTHRCTYICAYACTVHGELYSSYYISCADTVEALGRKSSDRLPGLGVPKVRLTSKYSDYYTDIHKKHMSYIT